MSRRVLRVSPDAGKTRRRKRNRRNERRNGSRGHAGTVADHGMNKTRRDRYSPPLFSKQRCRLAVRRVVKGMLC